MFRNRMGPGPGWEGARPGLLFLLFLALLLAVAVVGGIALFRSTRNRPGGVPVAPAWLPPDPALHELRLRYARGDIGREEYLQRAADLGQSGAQSGAQSGVQAGPPGAYATGPYPPGPYPSGPYPPGPYPSGPYPPAPYPSAPPPSSPPAGGIPPASPPAGPPPATPPAGAPPAL